MFKEYGPLSTAMYEKTKPVGQSLAGDLEYYKEYLLEKTQKSGGKILEAGVGTGRLLIPFANAGLDMVGVDISPEMLEKCKENCTLAGISAPLYSQDLQQLSLPYKFQGIIMPTGSFSLLPGRKAAVRFLQRALEHLAPGGELILDLELPVDFRVGEVSSTVVPLEESKGIVFTSTSLAMDWQEQKTTYLHRYEKWEHGELLQTELSQFVLHWYGIEEFALLLKEVGYRNVRRVYDYGSKEHYGAIATFHAEA